MTMGSDKKRDKFGLCVYMKVGFLSPQTTSVEIRASKPPCLGPTAASRLSMVVAVESLCK